MRISKSLFLTRKNENHLLDKATNRLEHGGFIHKESAGIFQFTNFGVRSLRKIEDLIRREHNQLGYQEVRLPLLQDIDLWCKSGRGTGYCGKETFRLKDRKEHVFFLAPTAEESATDLINYFVNSYKQLPITVYQISEKYRDEMRARFGLVRARQILMKDAYSFASDESEALQIYIDFFNLYHKIFKLLGLNAIAVAGDSGEIGGNLSHEFLIESNLGESEVFFNHLNNNGDLITNIKDLDLIQTSFNPIYANKVKAIEIGHIFYIGTQKYSENMKVLFNSKEGTKQPFYMGCYGIGVTRLLGVLMHNCEYLPSIVAPFDLHIIGINLKQSEIIYELLNQKIDILYDDRDQCYSTKLDDWKKIGIPKKLIIGKTMEFEDCEKKEKMVFNDINELLGFMTQFYYSK